MPSYAVTTERDCTRAVRREVGAAKRGVVLYTEESPVDVTSQVQDGQLHLRHALGPTSGLARAAQPDAVRAARLQDDRDPLSATARLGSWATGVKWIFFNGEAIWLQGPAAEWFQPDTRQDDPPLLRDPAKASRRLHHARADPARAHGTWRRLLQRLSDRGQDGFTRSTTRVTRRFAAPCSAFRTARAQPSTTSGAIGPPGWSVQARTT